MRLVNPPSIVLAFLAMSAPLSALRGGEPTERIKETTDKILAVVQDPELQGPAKTNERRKRIREAADERFDWAEICRRSLARHWKDRSGKEQEEFVALFIQYMEQLYLVKFELHYSDLKEIVYKDEKIVKGTYAMVTNTIRTKKGVDHPVEYRLKKKARGWLIYDVKIEGVSLVSNYRSQFGEIINKSGYEGLISTLQEKIKEARQNREQKD